MTTQEHIDGLISTIWNATENSSVTNLMVARVLDWLNNCDLSIRDEIEQVMLGHQTDIEAMQDAIANEKVLRQQQDAILRLLVGKMENALGGLKIQQISEADYEALVADDNTEDNILYLIKEEE